MQGAADIVFASQPGFALYPSSIPITELIVYKDVKPKRECYTG